MSKVYKVWIEIEEYDEESGVGETVPLIDFAATADFETLEEAHQFALALHEAGERLAWSWPTVGPTL